jgi:CMP-N-acetylneuraminic acid synthetase
VKYSDEIWGIVPARGGSKSIAYKNLISLNGRTLVQRAVEVAQESNCLDRVIVSTEDQRIASHCLDLNAEVHDRPQDLAEDDTHIVAVLKQLLEDYGDVEGKCPRAIILLQPTSPFIRPRDVSNCVKVMRGRDKWNSVQTVSLCPHQYHALNQRSLLNQQVAFISPGERELSYNKQTKDKHYVFGNVVGCRTKLLLEGGAIFSEPSYGIVIPLVFAFDLDVEEDIVIAETTEKVLAT